MGMTSKSMKDILSKYVFHIPPFLLCRLTYNIGQLNTTVMGLSH